MFKNKNKYLNRTKIKKNFDLENFSHNYVFFLFHQRELGNSARIFNFEWWKPTLTGYLKIKSEVLCWKFLLILITITTI